MIGAALLLGTPFFIVFGTLSDRIGRKPIIMAGCLLAALTFFPLFHALTEAANPDLAAAQAKNKVVVPPTRRSARSRAARSRARSTSRPRATSPSATWRRARSATTASTRRPARRRRSTIGDKTITPPAATVVNQKFDADSAAKIAAFKKEMGADLVAAGYPAKAKPIDFMSGQWWKVVAILWVLVIYVTMVYGPIAAMLVEMFPTRIRYTSMSVPYHFGNGWFGGLLPTTAFAIVASTGNMYNGLWYPIVIAAMTFVIGMLFIRETKDVDIYAQRSLTPRVASIDRAGRASAGPFSWPRGARRRPPRLRRTAPRAARAAGSSAPCPSRCAAARRRRRPPWAP